MIKKLSLLLLSGCMANNGLGTMSQSQDNVWNLSRLSVGMEESQVLEVMNYPYSKKTVEYEGGVYQVWFYVTRPVGLAQSRLVKQNLTPLMFENGMLLGWGNEFYQHLMRKKEMSGPQEKKEGEHENKELQETLEGMEKQTSFSSQVKKKNPPPSTEEKPKKEHSDEDLDEEDRKKIREAENQNFDFW